MLGSGCGKVKFVSKESRADEGWPVVGPAVKLGVVAGGPPVLAVRRGRGRILTLGNWNRRWKRKQESYDEGLGYVWWVVAARTGVSVA